LKLEGRTAIADVGNKKAAKQLRIPEDLNLQLRYRYKVQKKRISTTLNPRTWFCLNFEQGICEADGTNEIPCSDRSHYTFLTPWNRGLCPGVDKISAKCL